MSINIWLDDIRPAPKGFIWIKTVPELIEQYFQCVLDKDYKINIISLDNDLGEKEIEGYKFLDYIESRIIQYHYPLPNKICIHSANPVARKRMMQVINKIYNKE